MQSRSFDDCRGGFSGLCGGPELERAGELRDELARRARLQCLIVRPIHRQIPCADGLLLINPEQAAGCLHHRIDIEIELQKNHSTARDLKIHERGRDTDRGDQDLNGVGGVVEVSGLALGLHAVSMKITMNDRRRALHILISNHTIVCDFKQSSLAMTSSSGFRQCKRCRQELQTVTSGGVSVVTKVFEEAISR